MKNIFRCIALGAFLTGCTTMYYSFWETLGREKRDLLKSNVESAKSDQADVQEEFEDALTHIKRAYGMDGGKLEGVYKQIKSDHEDAVAKSKALSQRIEKIDSIGRDLFEEWAAEIKKISNPRYRQSSDAKLKASKQQFAGLMASLRTSEKKIPPVLKKLEDQVLFLKHNLNAMALGAFKAESQSIEKDIKALTVEMKKSIQASEDFAKTLESES